MQTPDWGRGLLAAWALGLSLIERYEPATIIERVTSSRAYFAAPGVERPDDLWSEPNRFTVRLELSGTSSSDAEGEPRVMGWV